MSDPRDEKHDLPDPELARVLRAAWAPEDLSPEEHRELVAQAVAPKQRRGRVVRVSFGASAIVALAASVLLVLSTDRAKPPGPPSVAPVLSLSRSTQSLFGRPFPATGGESARVDRIAMARAADLRENEFAKWGVR